MSGLNFLLWTIAVILILGVVIVVIFVTVCINGFCARKRAFKKISKRSGLMNRLKKAQAEREELLKRHNTK